MLNPEQVQETINDVQELKDKILERHQQDPTFCLRTESVFNQYINSLSYITGTVNPQTASYGFTPQPLKSVIGKPIGEKSSTKLNLPVISNDDIEAFKETVQLLHDGFLDRENVQLLDSLKEIEIRGVANIAGLDDFREAEINGAYIEKIKEKIKANKDLETVREQKKLELQGGAPVIEPAPAPVVDQAQNEGSAPVTTQEDSPANNTPDPADKTAGKNEKPKTQNTKK
ncbi:hypothetical protein CHRYSEOSP005_00040 [Chryseobacterium sp. Alg-005]|uniref:hypothetical protein n=1 Tax=Chryseobacterium sp. Alg-005 TaxID=3159516 RepID=UPI00355576D2